MHFMLLVVSLILIFTIIFRCNTSYDNLKPIFKVILKLELELSEGTTQIAVTSNIAILMKCVFVAFKTVFLPDTC